MEVRINESLTCSRPALLTKNIASEVEILKNTPITSTNAHAIFKADPERLRSVEQPQQTSSASSIVMLDMELLHAPKPSNTIQLNQKVITSLETKVGLFSEETLFIAARKGDFNAIREYLETGLDPDILDKGGSTALHWASKKGHESIVSLLLQYKCTLDIQDLKGQTALHLAVKRKHEAVVRLLVSRGASVALTDCKGRLASNLISRFHPIRKILSDESFRGSDLELKIPFKYLDESEAPEFSVLGSGSFNTVYKVVYYQDSKKFTKVYKREIPLIEGNIGAPKTLGINPNDPKTCFRNCIYAEMAEQLDLNIAPVTHLGIYKQGLYTVMSLAEGCKPGGQEVKVKLIEDCELTRDLTHYYRTWDRTQDWNLYIKEQGIIDLLASYGLTGLEDSIVEGSKILWYGTALIEPKVAIDLDDPNLNKAIGAMQLLDLLMFQLDRNLGNFLIKTDSKGKFEQLTTIDNDFCVSRYYLNKEVLIKENPKAASSLMFPIWVDPEIAQKFLDFEASDVERVFKIFGNIFDIEEIRASQKMLDTIKSHLVQIQKQGTTAAEFKNHCESQIWRIQGGVEDCKRKQLQYEGHVWENIESALNALPDNINAIDQHRRTALHRAAIKGDLDSIRMLLFRKATVEVRDFQGQTPFQLAVEKGHIDVVKLFLERKDKVYLNGKNSRQRTAVHTAALHGRTAILELLVKFHGGNLADRDAEGKLPIHLAAENGHLETFQMLLGLGMVGLLQIKYTNIKDAKGFTPLHLSVLSPESHILRVLLEKGADPFIQDNKGRTPLHIAAEQGRIDKVWSLLKKVSYFRRSQYLEIPDIEGKTALELAVNFGQQEVVSILLDQGADPSKKNNAQKTLLHVSVESENIEVIRLLFNKRIPINAQDEEGNTALHIAAELNQLSTVRLFLSTGIYSDLRNNLGQTALHIAAHEGHIEIIRLLLNKGMSPNIRDNIGNTPLHVAARRGYIEIIRLLLAKGASIGSENTAFYTPLQLAARRGHKKTFEFLIQKGALKATSQSSNYCTVSLVFTNLNEAMEGVFNEIRFIDSTFHTYAVKRASKETNIELMNWLQKHSS